MSSANKGKLLLEEFGACYVIPQEKLAEFKSDVDYLYYEDYEKAFLDASESFDKRWDEYKLVKVTDDEEGA